MLLRAITERPGHRFWSDDVDLTRLDWFDSLPLVGYHQVTDLRLVALALARGGRVVTFDRGIRSLVPKAENAAKLVEVLDDNR